MKLNPAKGGPRVRGLSLIEVSLVITVMMSLVSMLVVGAKTWRRGSDRASCIMDVRAMQMAVRSYQNIYGYNYGGRPHAKYGTQDISRHLFEKGYIDERQFKQAQGELGCSGGGLYTAAFPDVFPEEGFLYMACSLADSHDHKPADTASW